MSTTENKRVIYIELTERQHDALKQLVRDGADNQTIARRLGINIETVKSHLGVVYQKTGYSNRTAVALGLIRGEIVVKPIEPPEVREARLDELAARPPVGLQGPRLARSHASLGR